MTIYNTENGVKPRYDGGGSEFGLMHRDLGPGYCMFDIDRMSAVLEVDLKLKREETGFIEYRHNGGIRFVAIFEIKYEKTVFSLAALDTDRSSTMAQIEMARRLDARLFAVFGTDGGQPFEFWEYNPEASEYQMIGVLTYSQDDRMQRVRAFWQNTLGIDR